MVWEITVMKYPSCKQCGTLIFDASLDNFRGRKRQFCIICAKSRQLLAIQRSRARRT
jgi:hypothetical protein